MKVIIVKHVIKAVITETVIVGSHISRIPDVIMMYTVNIVEFNEVFNHRNQPLVGIAGAPMGTVRLWSWVATGLLTIHIWQRWRLTFFYFKWGEKKGSEY